MSFRLKFINEIKAIGITALYFGCWIAALMFLKSLVLAEYQIAFHGWSAAVAGALILSKVLLILENVSLGAWVRARPAWVDVVLRTAMYSLGVVVVLVLEKGFEGRHEYGGFGPALRQLGWKVALLVAVFAVLIPRLAPAFYFWPAAILGLLLLGLIAGYLLDKIMFNKKKKPKKREVLNNENLTSFTSQ